MKTVQLKHSKVPPAPTKKVVPMPTIVLGFSTFLREQGIISLAIAVVLGAAVTRLVGSFVADIINPFVGVLLGAAGDLSSMVLIIGPIEVRWGSFVTALVDFVVIAAVVYLLIKLLRLDELAKKK